MFDQTEFKKNGNYYSVKCINITEDVKSMIERFCREKISSGADPLTGIVISSDYEIRYLNLKGTANGQLSINSESECEYMLEF